MATTDGLPRLISLRLERAVRWAARHHRAQTRKGSDVPYVQHVVCVALVLDRLGFDEDVVIAGFLHDLVEDTQATLDEVRAEFGDDVATIVDFCSEVKTDGQGKKRPWIDRKRDHLEALANAPAAARAVVLADKLHNLLSIEADLRDGRPVWPIFNANRNDVLWYYRATLDRIGSGDPRLERLSAQCREVLAAIESLQTPPGVVIQ